ncbi:MAG: hypothetical protein MI745_06655 [Pseudomonadales bacterium]|nr:hypothetical protein [Pseudomonadales bacterium]
MKKFLKKVSEWGVVGLLVGFGLSFTGLDPVTSKTISTAAESASDAAIERHIEE